MSFPGALNVKIRFYPHLKRHQYTTKFKIIILVQIGIHIYNNVYFLLIFFRRRISECIPVFWRKIYHRLYFKGQGDIIKLISSSLNAKNKTISLKKLEQYYVLTSRYNKNISFIISKSPPEKLFRPEIRNSKHSIDQK